MLARLIVILSLLSASACTNLMTANKYNNQGIVSMNNGDYGNAAEMFRRAVINAELAYLDKAAVGTYLRHYAIALGKNCQPLQAEAAFKKAIAQFDDNFGVDSGRSAQSRAEYFSFLSDAGRHEEAAEQISPILPIIDKKFRQQNADDITEDYLNFLKDYAYALHKSGDVDLTTEVMNRINEINPGQNIDSVIDSVLSAREEKTHYPDNCPPEPG